MKSILGISKFLFKKKIDFQNSIHNAQFLGLFKNRTEAVDAQKDFNQFNSYSLLLNYLYNKFPDGKIPHYDYPLLFHYNIIHEKLKRPLVVNDFGGSFGVHYHSVSKALPMTIDNWHIYEEDCIIGELENLSSTITNNKNIDFHSIDEIYKESDLVYISGSLQYYGLDSVNDLICKLPKKPKYVILNQLPLDPDIEENMYTLQNVFNQIVISTIFSQKSLTDKMLSYGYRLADQWNDFSSNCDIIDNEYFLPYFGGQYYISEN